MHHRNAFGNCDMIFSSYRASLTPMIWKQLLLCRTYKNNHFKPVDFFESTLDVHTSTSDSELGESHMCILLLRRITVHLRFEDFYSRTLTPWNFHSLSFAKAKRLFASIHWQSQADWGAERQKCIQIADKMHYGISVDCRPWSWIKKESGQLIPRLQW